MPQKRYRNKEYYEQKHLLRTQFERSSHKKSIDGLVYNHTRDSERYDGKGGSNGKAHSNREYYRQKYLLRTQFGRHLRSKRNNIKSIATHIVDYSGLYSGDQDNWHYQYLGEEEGHGSHSYEGGSVPREDQQCCIRKAKQDAQAAYNFWEPLLPRESAVEGRLLRKWEYISDDGTRQFVVPEWRYGPPAGTFGYYPRNCFRETDAQLAALLLEAIQPLDLEEIGQNSYEKWEGRRMFFNDYEFWTASDLQPGRIKAKYLGLQKRPSVIGQIHPKGKVWIPGAPLPKKMQS